MLPTFFPDQSSIATGPTLKDMLARSLSRRGLLAGQPNAERIRQEQLDRTDGLGYERSTYGKLKDKIQNFAALTGSSYNALVGSLGYIGPIDNPAAKYFDENSALYEANVSDTGKYRMKKNAAEMALLGKDDYLGQAKLATKQAFQNPDIFLGKAAGNLAGAASVGAVAAAAMPEASASAISGLVAGAFGLGADRQSAVQAVDDATEDELKGDPRYVAALKASGNEKAAREALKQHVASYDENAFTLASSTALSALLGMAGSDPKWIGLLQKATKGEISTVAAREAAKALMAKDAAKGFVSSALKSGAREMGTEFLDEASQQLAGNVMAGGGGAKIDPMAGVVQAGTEAALMSAVPGFAAGPTEVLQAKVGQKQIQAQQNELEGIDARNKFRKEQGLGTYAKIPEIGSETTDPAGPGNPPGAPPAPPVAPPAQPEAPSTQSEFRQSITDPTEAAVFDGMVSGVQPGQVLNSLGVSADQIPKLSRKYITTFGNKALEERKLLARTVPTQETVAEVPAPALAEAQPPSSPVATVAPVEEAKPPETPATTAIPSEEPSVEVKHEGQTFKVTPVQAAAIEALPKNRKGYPQDKSAVRQIIGQQAIPATGVGKEVSHAGREAVITASNGNMRAITYADTGEKARVKAVDIKQRQQPTVKQSSVSFAPGTPEREANLAKFSEGLHPIAKNEDGTPKTFYTGTSKDKDFSSFRIGDRGAFFSPDPGIASNYSMENDSKGYTWERGKPVEKNTASRVLPVHLDVRNPYHLTVEEAAKYQKASSYQKAQREIAYKARSAGHDSVIYPDGSVVVFKPQQIKSATGNRGTFDTTSKSIKQSDEVAKSKLINSRYNGILPKDRDSAFKESESRGKKVDGRNEIIIDPAKDGVSSAIKQLAKHTEMTAAVARAFDVIAARSGISTAKFAGWTVSGNVYGTNYGTTESGRVYVNPLTIAKRKGFDSYLTAAGIYANLLHEIAHQRVVEHGTELDAEIARISKEIGVDLENQIITDIENSLHMGSLKSITNQQQEGWSEAWSRAEKLVQQQRDILSGKETHETAKNDEQRPDGGVNARGSNVNADGGPAEGAGNDRGAGEAGNQRKGNVPSVVAGKAEGLATGSEPVGSPSAPGANSPAVVDEQADELAAFPWWKQLAAKIVNRYNRIGQVVSENIENMATEATPRAVANIENVAQMFVKPLAKLLNESGETQQTFELWAVAKNQLEKRGETIKKRGGKLPFTDASAAMMVKKYEKNPQFQKAHKMLMQVMQMQRDLLVGSGLVSKKEMDAAVEAMGEFYVPWKQIESKETFGGGTVGGLGVSGPDLRMSMGSKKNPTSVIASALEQYNRTAVRAEHNRVLNALADFIKDDFVNDEKSYRNWAIDKEGAPSDEVVDFHNQGVQKKIWIRDPILLQQIRGMKPSELSAFFEKMNGFTTFYKQLSTTLNPIFPFTNFMRDLPLGLSRVFVSEGKNAAREVAGNLWTALKAVNEYKKDTSIDPATMPESTPEEKAKKRWMQMAKTMFVSGAVPGWRGMETAESIRTDFINEMKRQKPGATSAARRQAAVVGEVMKRFNETIEAGIRLSYFEYLMRKHDKAEPTQQEQTAISKKVRALTADFQQRGEMSRQLGAMYPFFNASIQGLNAVGELVVKAGKGDKRAIALFSTLAALGIAEDMINSAIGGDDDDDGIPDYDEMPDWLRRSKFIIPALGNKSVTLPMTYGLSVAVNAGKLLSRTHRGAMTPGEFGREMAQAINESTNPIGGSGSALQTVSPLATDWMVQIAENKDWKGNKIFPDRYPGQEWKPNSEMASRRDTEISKALARGINAATGGSEVSKGALASTPFGDMTPYPGAIDAMGQWIGGGLGRLIADVGKSAYGYMTPDTGDNPDKIPVISGFISGPEQSFYVGRFFRQANELKALRGQAQDLAARARREELVKEYPDRKTAIENASAQDLQNMLPEIQNMEELRKNLEEIKAQRLRYIPMFDAISKKIKNLEESGDPDADRKIKEMVLSANKKLNGIS